MNTNEGSRSFEELVEDPNVSLRQIASSYGRTRDWVKSEAHRLGLKLPQEKAKEIDHKPIPEEIQKYFWEQLDGKIQAIPPIATFATPKIISRGRGNEEIQVVCISDTHIGTKTKSYNSEIFKERLQILFNKVVSIAKLHRCAFPIRELYIFKLGDLVTGERLGFQLNLDEFELPVHKQILDVGMPAFCEFYLNLLKHFDKIKIFAVEGNHGWPGGKFSSAGTNWDIILEELCRAKLSNYKRIQFYIEREAFYQLVEIKNHHFMLFHGDQIPMHYSLPFYGISSRTSRWKGSVEPDMSFAQRVLESYKAEKIPVNKAILQILQLPFSTTVSGHFHSRAEIKFNDVTSFLNGTFMTGDEYPLKRMGLGGMPEQWTFGVNETHGVTWRYPLVLQ